VSKPPQRRKISKEKTQKISKEKTQKISKEKTQKISKEKTQTELKRTKLKSLSGPPEEDDTTLKLLHLSLVNIIEIN